MSERHETKDESINDNRNAELLAQIIPYPICGRRFTGIRATGKGKSWSLLTKCSKCKVENFWDIHNSNIRRIRKANDLLKNGPVREDLGFNVPGWTMKGSIITSHSSFPGPRQPRRMNVWNEQSDLEQRIKAAEKRSESLE